MEQSSINKRYAYKLTTNLLTFFINVVTAGIVPRALGKETYGFFNYITTVMTQVTTLLDLRTSTCFFTKLSQRPDDHNLFIFYNWYSYAIGLLTLLFGLLVGVSPFSNFVFSTTSISLITFAAIYVYLRWLMDRFTGIMDANGATVPMERMRIMNKLVSTAVVIVLYVVGVLNLTVYFLYLFVVTFMLIWVILRYLHKHTTFQLKPWPLPQKEVMKAYFKEFWKYSKPLAWYVILSFITITFDRWILQRHGGDAQQGLYSFSFALCNFALLFVTAIVPIFIREMSIFAKNNEVEKIGHIYKKYVPTLYTLTAYFSIFIFVESGHLIQLFGGKDYAQSSLSFACLAFYPLVSTYSNLNASVIYATGKTNVLLRNILLLAPIGILLSYFLTKNSGLGLGLGAFGLALKTVSIEGISVIIILFIVCKYMRISPWYFLTHMIYSLLPFFAFGFASVKIVSFIDLQAFAHLFPAFMMRTGTSMIHVLLSGMLYTLLSGAMLFLYPRIFGLQRTTLYMLLEKVKATAVKRHV